MQELTRKEKREFKRQEKIIQLKRANRLKRFRGFVTFSALILLIIGGAGYGIFRLAKHAPAQTYTSEPVHWHALVDIEICGEKRDLPKSPSGEIGTHLLHAHNDNTIHVEGRVIEKEDIALGRFFDLMGVSFDRGRIMDKKNGDTCSDGKQGFVKMSVNGTPNNEFRDFIPKAETDASKQIISIKFD